MINSSNLFALFLVSLFGLTLLGCNASPKTSALGEMAPDFALNDVSGNPLQLSYYRGKVVLLRFWAHWCQNCELEMAEIEFSYQKLIDRGFVVLAVYVKPENETLVMDLVQELKLTFPVLIDGNGEVASKYGVVGLPTSIIIDKKGVIREKVLGEGLNRKELYGITAPYF